MFPINWNFPFIKKNGIRTTIGAALDNAGIQYQLPAATETTLGGVKVGSGLNIDESGVLSAPTYQLPAATGSTLGGVKVGSGLNIDGSGVLSAPTQESVKYFDGSLIAKNYTGETWKDSMIDVSSIDDHTHKTYIGIAAREGGYTVILNNINLASDTYLTAMVYPINNATNKAVSVRVFYV